MDVVCVNRIGAGYNDDFAVNEFASATHIRQLIYNNESFEKYILFNLEIKE